MLTTNDITRILNLYDLGKFYGVTQARRGFVNETAFVQTSKGRFVLRRSHRRLSESALRYGHDLTAWLIKRDFPVPALVAAKDGSTLLNVGGRFYEMREFVQGDDFDPSRPRQIGSVGATLARYHQAIQGFPAPGPIADPRYSPQTVMGLVERLLERDAMGELYEPLGWYDRRAAALRTPVSRGRYRSVPHLVIHGDVHSDNFLFMGDEVTVLLDFDQATWDARIVDLADALVAFATNADIPGWNAWGVFQGPLDEARATRLVAGYHAVAALSPTEIELLPQLVELIWLQGELGRVISTPEGSPDYHQDVLEQGRWLSNWMRERSQRLSASWMTLSETTEQVAAALAA